MQVSLQLHRILPVEDTGSKRAERTLPRVPARSIWRLLPSVISCISSCKRAFIASSVVLQVSVFADARAHPRKIVARMAGIGIVVMIFVLLFQLYPGLRIFAPLIFDFSTCGPIKTHLFRWWADNNAKNGGKLAKNKEYTSETSGKRIA